MEPECASAPKPGTIPTLNSDLDTESATKTIKNEEINEARLMKSFFFFFPQLKIKKR